MACQQEWAAARELLQQGGFEAFLADRTTIESLRFGFRQDPGETSTELERLPIYGVVDLVRQPALDGWALVWLADPLPTYLYVGSMAGHLSILDAQSGKVLAQVPAPGGVRAAPAVANDAVYFFKAHW